MAQKPHFKLINIFHLSKIAEVNYYKVRDSLASDKPKYNSLSDNEKTQLANTLFSGLKKVFSDLGREITWKDFSEKDFIK